MERRRKFVKSRTEAANCNSRSSSHGLCFVLVGGWTKRKIALRWNKNNTKRLSCKAKLIAFICYYFMYTNDDPRRQNGMDPGQDQEDEMENKRLDGWLGRPGSPLN